MGALLLIVAQTFQSAVSQVFQPAECGKLRRARQFGGAADWKVGDTADWKVRATMAGDGDFSILGGNGSRFRLSHAAEQFWKVYDERIVLMDPQDDHFRSASAVRPQP